MGALAASGPVGQWGRKGQRDPEQLTLKLRLAGSRISHERSPQSEVWMGRCSLSGVWSASGSRASSALRMQRSPSASTPWTCDSTRPCRPGPRGLRTESGMYASPATFFQHRKACREFASGRWRCCFDRWVAVLGPRISGSCPGTFVWERVQGTQFAIALADLLATRPEHDWRSGGRKVGDTVALTCAPRPGSATQMPSVP